MAAVMAAVVADTKTAMASGKCEELRMMLTKAPLLSLVFNAALLGDSLDSHQQGCCQLLPRLTLGHCQPPPRPPLLSLAMAADTGIPRSGRHCQ